MKVFQNPFWLFCVIIFLVHQVFQKTLEWNIPILDNYLDPLLCLPIFMGIMLAERRFFLKKLNYNTTYTFSPFETITISIVLSVIFEEGFSRWSNHLTKDYIDYFFYFVGALLFHHYINVNVCFSRPKRKN